MTLLPNPGKPGFYGVGLPGRVIWCQSCPSISRVNAAIYWDLGFSCDQLRICMGEDVEEKMSIKV